MIRWMVLALALAGCSVPLAELPSGADHEVTVVDFGWHTVIVLEGADVRAAAPAYPQLNQALTEVSEAPWLEFGWGEAVIFADTATIEEVKLSEVIPAVFWPTPALVQIVPRGRAPAQTYRGAQVTLPVSAAQFEALMAGLEASFTPPVEGVSGGFDAGARFFPARERYHAFQNCNSWTAERLREAGIAAPGGWVVSSENLVRRLGAGG
ncbi:MAG: DUF2459 domain-containing protein [Pseudomonadota bacterium]